MTHLIASSSHGKRVCAAAARLSTKSGAAMDIFNASDAGAKDENLIKKVISSGHKSLLEHQFFSFALDDVSVFVEQCLIEFRLASFTVKSRRYVDFKTAGYYMPPYLSKESQDKYRRCMDELFEDYARLTDLGIPKEDARFVLPYCFYSNLFFTCNARELLRIIKAFTTGRLSANDEIRTVGNQLSVIIDSCFPGVLDYEKDRLACAVLEPSTQIARESVCEGKARLIAKPANALELLNDVMMATGRFSPNSYGLLARDDRPRELECLSYTFLISDISQACATHFARHRIQSPIFDSPSQAISKNRFILPATIAENEEASEIYLSAFSRHTKEARELIDLGLKANDAVYLSLSGNTINAVITMNAREIRHFMNLRTCERAQWEIRSLAKDMLLQLVNSCPELFSHYGPSCMTYGACPEGRLSCGHPRQSL